MRQWWSKHWSEVAALALVWAIIAVMIFLAELTK